MPHINNLRNRNRYPPPTGDPYEELGAVGGENPSEGTSNTTINLQFQGNQSEYVVDQPPPYTPGDLSDTFQANMRQLIQEQEENEQVRQMLETQQHALMMAQDRLDEERQEIQGVALRVMEQQQIAQNQQSSFIGRCCRAILGMGCAAALFVAGGITAISLRNYLPETIRAALESGPSPDTATGSSLTFSEQFNQRCGESLKQAPKPGDKSLHPECERIFEQVSSAPRFNCDIDTPAWVYAHTNYVNFIRTVPALCFGSGGCSFINPKTAGYIRNTYSRGKLKHITVIQPSQIREGEDMSFSFSTKRGTASLTARYTSLFIDLPHGGSGNRAATHGFSPASYIQHLIDFMTDITKQVNYSFGHREQIEALVEVVEIMKKYDQFDIGIAKAAQNFLSDFKGETRITKPELVLTFKEFIEKVPMFCYAPYSCELFGREKTALAKDAELTYLPQDQMPPSGKMKMKFGGYPSPQTITGQPQPAFVYGSAYHFMTNPIKAVSDPSIYKFELLSFINKIIGSDDSPKETKQNKLIALDKLLTQIRSVDPHDQMKFLGDAKNIVEAFRKKPEPKTTTTRPKVSTETQKTQSTTKPTSETLPTLESTTSASTTIPEPTSPLSAPITTYDDFAKIVPTIVYCPRGCQPYTLKKAFSWSGRGGVAFVPSNALVSDEFRLRYHKESGFSQQMTKIQHPLIVWAEENWIPAWSARIQLKTAEKYKMQLLWTMEKIANENEVEFFTVRNKNEGLTQIVNMLNSLNIRPELGIYEAARDFRDNFYKENRDEINHLNRLSEEAEKLKT